MKRKRMRWEMGSSGERCSMILNAGAMATEDTIGRERERLGKG